MKTKEKYIQPEIEIVEVELEGTIAQSGGYSQDMNNPGTVGGDAYSKKREFWGE